MTYSSTNYVGQSRTGVNFGTIEGIRQPRPSPRDALVSEFGFHISEEWLTFGCGQQFEDGEILGKDN